MRSCLKSCPRSFFLRAEFHDKIFLNEIKPFCDLPEALAWGIRRLEARHPSKADELLLYLKVTPIEAPVLPRLRGLLRRPEIPGDLLHRLAAAA
ncbi:MAG: hypothetical protein AAF191_08940 [Verrucomicrobiota bacterium]